MGKFIKGKTEQYFKKITNISLITAIIDLIIGICLIVFPLESMKTIGYILGASFVISSISTGYKYFKRSGAKLYRYNIVFAIIELIMGILIICVPYTVATFVTALLGLYLIVYGSQKVSYGIWFKMGNDPTWIITLVIGIMFIIFGVLVMINPFTALALTALVGIFIFLAGIIELTSTIMLRRRASEVITIFWS